MEVYLREHPRYPFTSTERENTNPHHIGTTRPHIYRIPPETDHKSQGPQPPTERARTTDAGHPHPRQRFSGEHPVERVQQDISIRLFPKV